MSTEQPRSRNRKKKVVAVVAGVAVLGTAGVAYAYWTADGSGTGSATAGTTVNFSVVQDSAIINLRPGGAVQTLSGHFVNKAPQSANTSVTKVTPSIASIKDSAGNVVAGCTTADFTLGAVTFATPITVAADSDTTLWSGATIVLKETGSNQDACKGVTVNLNYAAATA